jgi:hypothetical protein
MPDPDVAAALANLGWAVLYNAFNSTGGFLHGNTTVEIVDYRLAMVAIAIVAVVTLLMLHRFLVDITTWVGYAALVALLIVGLYLASKRVQLSTTTTTPSSSSDMAAAAAVHHYHYHEAPPPVRLQLDFDERPLELMPPTPPPPPRGRLIRPSRAIDSGDGNDDDEGQSP